MTHTNSDLEKVLYSIIQELSKDDSPIIFKGALALKDLLYINNPNLDIERHTTDIDANWITKYNKEEIFKTIEKAVKKVNPNYNIELSREPAENRSMGFKILDEKGSTISKLDMDIKDNPFYVVFTINNVNIKYSSFDKMMADKLLSISGEHIFRRIKDLLDIYMITSDNEVKYEDIKKVLDYENRHLGDFTTMLTNKDIIRDSYNKLEGINNKPPFDTVWNSVLDYLEKEEIIDEFEKDKDLDIER